MDDCQPVRLDGRLWRSEPEFPHIANRRHTFAQRNPGRGRCQSDAGAGRDRLPFQGSFTRETHAVFEPPITLVITGTETGTASHLGRFTATSEDRVNTTNNTATGTLNITAANGDQLFTRTAGAETRFSPPNISMVTATATVLGGTGRFERATGTFTIESTDTIDFATGSATGSGKFEGHINLNR